jgi:DNA-binding transcriptional LysR family regulator
MSFLTLDLNLLRVFDAVMTEHNLTRAANRLAMTQPAVSNALRRLRDALDDELVIRTAHGVKPTARADELWPTVRKALSDLEEAVAPNNFDLTTVRTTFRMAMADATAVLWLPELMKCIENEAPGVDVRMVPLTTRDPRPMLLRADIDLAIGIFPGVAAQLSGATDTPVRHDRLYSGHYVCVMRKDHPLADKELTLDAYCDANHLLMSFSGRAHGMGDRESIFYRGPRGGELRPDHRAATSPDYFYRHEWFIDREGAAVRVTGRAYRYAVA